MKPPVSTETLFSIARRSAAIHDAIMERVQFVHDWSTKRAGGSNAKHYFKMLKEALRLGAEEYTKALKQFEEEEVGR